MVGNPGSALSLLLTSLALSTALARPPSEMSPFSRDQSIGFHSAFGLWYCKAQDLTCKPDTLFHADLGTGFTYRYTLPAAPGLVVEGRIDTVLDPEHGPATYLTPALIWRPGWDWVRLHLGGGLRLDTRGFLCPTWSFGLVTAFGTSLWSLETTWNVLVPWTGGKTGATMTVAMFRHY